MQYVKRGYPSEHHVAFNPYNAEIVVHKLWNFFFQFEITVNVLSALSASFEYLCYGSMAVIHY